jgi:hypothetical protein
VPQHAFVDRDPVDRDPVDRDPVDHDSRQAAASWRGGSATWLSTLNW